MVLKEIFSNHTSDKGISQLYQKFKQLNSKTTITPIKLNKVPEQAFLKRRYKNGKQVNENVFNILVIGVMEIHITVRS